MSPTGTRTINSSVTPLVASLHYSTDPSTLGSIQLPSPAPAPDAAAPSHPAKKKRSHGKARPPGHIPRPPNAFIIFRTEYIKSLATQNSTPEMSKSLGERWRMMSASEKRPWVEKAEAAKLQHQVDNPGYKYKPVHPRDEFGNCIRKPRKPNRPRVKKIPQGRDMAEHVSNAFSWLEGKPDAEFPNADLPSDASCASSPPPSPSPTPSWANPSSSYQFPRRSSSVPLVGPNEPFFGEPSTWSLHSATPTAYHTSHFPRRLSKRPSTSMDFMSAGPSTDSFSPNNNIGANMYLSADITQLRQGHRRSISAPGFSGELSQITYTPSQALAPDLTPINPVFGNVFDKFSWNLVSNSTNPTANTQYAPNGFSGIPPYVDPGQRHQEYITLDIPSATSSPASNLDSAISPPISTPSSQICSSPAVQHLAIQHPAPVASFDFSAFQSEISQYDYTPGPDGAGSHLQHQQPQHHDAFATLVQTCQPDAGVMYNNGDAIERFFAQVGDHQHQARNAVGQVMHTTGGDDMAGLQVPAAAPTDNAGVLRRTALDRAAGDLQAYQEGMRYSQRRPEIRPPCLLDFSELIVDGY